MSNGLDITDVKALWDSVRDNVPEKHCLNVAKDFMVVILDSGILLDEEISELKHSDEILREAINLIHKDDDDDFDDYEDDDYNLY